MQCIYDLFSALATKHNLILYKAHSIDGRSSLQLLTYKRNKLSIVLLYEINKNIWYIGRKHSKLEIDLNDPNSLDEIEKAIIHSL